MKKIVVLSGAGISKESGINTFRDSGGLWDEYKVEDVATITGWNKNRKKVLDFYNKRRADLKDKKPNEAHILLKELEKFYDVTIITQNVDDLHEKAGSSKILHLHGELTKVKIEDKDLLMSDDRYDIGYDPIYLGDTPAKFGHKIDPDMINQLRPDIVWFGEDVPLMEEAYDLVNYADIFLVIGTSLQVYPAANLIDYPKTNCDIYIINPDMEPIMTSRKIHYIEEVATKGMNILFNHLTK